MKLVPALFTRANVLEIGKEFQTMGPCTANARRPTVDSRCRGTTISCCVADLRRCLPTTSVTGVQQLIRYWLATVLC